MAQANGGAGGELSSLEGGESSPESFDTYECVRGRLRLKTKLKLYAIEDNKLPLRRRTASNKLGRQRTENVLFAKPGLREQKGDGNVKTLSYGNLDFVETKVTNTLQSRS